MTISTVQDAKAAAKTLRATRAAQGTAITHAQALEQIAHDNGARDWNTLRAGLSQAAPATWQHGARVTGHYFGQAFSGRLIVATLVAAGTRVVIALDTPLDAVRFASFSNLRRQIRGTVGADGCTKECTSDGIPHLKLDAPA